MTRHPGTEGNDLRPRRVDARDDMTVGGASVADAAAGFFIQDTEPVDPPNGARWTDTSSNPPRTRIYDDSTNAWIPINAGDRTFVSDTEPDDLLKGDIWFDTSPEDGTDMLWFDGSRLNFLQFIPALPDSVVSNMEYYWTMEDGSGGETTDELSGETITLDGAGWEPTTDFGEYEYVTTYDGIGDRWITENIDANTTQFTWAKWVFVESVDDFDRIMITLQDPGDENPDDGWRFGIGSNAPELTYRHAENGSLNNAFNGPEDAQLDEWVFFAIAADGDDAEIYGWDTDSQFINRSINENRGIEFADLYGMGSDDFYTEGKVAAAMGNDQEQVSESDLEQIWEDTKPE